MANSKKHDNSYNPKITGIRKPGKYNPDFKRNYTRILYRHKKDLYDSVRNYYPYLH